MPAFALRNIRPNPFRHVERYPIQRDKVEQLRESIRATGFWDNVVARLENGKPEIAYGHHRLEALRQELGPSKKVYLIIRNLSDEDMLQIMARENMQEWGTSAIVEQETVRAVVEAYADGRIELAGPSTTASRKRFAPSFSREEGYDGPRTLPYTAQTVAAFLGWSYDKVQSTLAALELIERKAVDGSLYDKLSTDQARAVTTETNKRVRAYGERDAKKAAAAVVSKIEKAKKKPGGAIDIKAEFAQVKPLPVKETQQKKIQNIETFTDKLANSVGSFLNTNHQDPTADKFDLLVKNLDGLTKRRALDLARTLDGLAKRATRYADRIRAFHN